MLAWAGTGSAVSTAKERQAKPRTRLLGIFLGTCTLLDAELRQGILIATQAQSAFSEASIKMQRRSTWGVAESFKRARLASTVDTVVALCAAHMLRPFAAAPE